MIDEPSVFDYGPQHQSTCGLDFNEPVNGGPIFGPAHWAGDALVTGYSRGKLFRTKLVEDAGRLRRAESAAGRARTCWPPMPASRRAATWSSRSTAACPTGAAGPRGRASSTRSTTATAKHLSRCSPGPRARRRSASRSTGRSTRAICATWPDDLDRIRPSRAPRRPVRVVASGLRGRGPADGLAPIRSADPLGPGLRRPALAVAGHRTAPGGVVLCHDPAGLWDRPTRQEPGPASFRRVAAVELGYDLCGVDATWRPEAGEEGWTGWLPHLDLAVARAFTAGSAEHDRLWEAIEPPGRLTLRTRLDLWQMLRPAVQPGSTTGYTPAGRGGHADFVRLRPDRR